MKHEQQTINVYFKSNYILCISIIRLHNRGQDERGKAKAQNDQNAMLKNSEEEKYIF